MTATGTPARAALVDALLDVFDAVALARDEARTEAAYLRAALAAIQSRADSALKDETTDRQHALERVAGMARDALASPIPYWR